MTTASQSIGSRVGVDHFEHLALLYRDAEQYLSGTVGYVRAALAAESPVLVAVPQPNLDLIRDGLGSDAGDVDLVDMSVVGRNPGGIIPGVLIDFAKRHTGHRVSIIGETTWPGRSTMEYPACTTHEALINTVFAGRDASILCAYDVAGLPDAAIADARGTHPVMVDAGGNRQASARYTDPLRTEARFNEPLPAPPSNAATMHYRLPTELAVLRAFVTACAADAGVAPERAGKLALSVNELATNTLQHSGGPGMLSVWREPSALVCQVDDGGFITDPLAGRVPPPEHQLHGRGLLLVNQFSDLVRMHTRPGHTTVRVYTYR